MNGESDNEQRKELSIINQMDLLTKNDPVWFSKYPRVVKFGEWIKAKLRTVIRTCLRFEDLVWKIFVKV